MGYLDGAARALLQYVQAVVLACQCGTEVFRAEVVDELHLGLVVAFQLAGGNDPTERVVLLAQIARQRTIKFLSRHLYVLFVEVDAQVDAIFFIYKVREKRFVFCAFCAQTGIVNNIKKAICSILLSIFTFFCGTKVINLNQETIVYVENICENIRSFIFFKYLCSHNTCISNGKKLFKA